MNKKILSIILGTILIVPNIIGCGGNKSSNDVLKVGIDDTYPPMEFVDESGDKAIGFDIDFANAIGEKIGKKVEFQSNDWTGIFSALDNGKFDCIISSVSITEEREKAFNMTQPYIANNLVIVTKKDNETIKSPEDLKTLKGAVQSGTTADDFLAETLDEDKYSKYEALTQAMDDLKIGRIDAVCVDVVVAKYYLNKSADDFKVSWESDEPDKFGICIKKGNDELTEDIEKAVDELYESGKVAEISEKWFGEDITKGVR